MTRVASLHIATFAKKRLLSRLLTIPADKWEMSETNGCLFAKVMGTSKAHTTKTSVEWGRWCVFAVWEDEAALHAFLADSPVVKRWKPASVSFTSYRLAPISARGSWAGVEPFPGLVAPEDDSSYDGPVAVLTRARVKWSKMWTFYKAIPAVDDFLQKQPGNRLAVGMGEWPIGEQATFSLWDSPEAINAFAYNNTAHNDVIKRTYREGWYSEELFARFRATEL